jgi:hypothetical protein
MATAIVIADELEGRNTARLTVAIDGDEPLDRLIASGAITPATSREAGTLPRRVRPRQVVSELVAEQRR